MDSEPQHRVTALLRAASDGDKSASDRLAPIVLEELRRIAVAAWSKEKRQVTLQPTLLANEAFMRLVGSEGVDWNDRSHFYALAARAIRRMLVDHARSRDRLKRGGDGARIELDMASVPHDGANTFDLLALHDALDRLAELDPHQAQIVELKYFGGLTSEQAASVLGVSTRKVDGEWAMARAWLRRELARK